MTLYSCIIIPLYFTYYFINEMLEFGFNLIYLISIVIIWIIGIIGFYVIKKFVVLKRGRSGF